MRKAPLIFLVSICTLLQGQAPPAGPEDDVGYTVSHPECIFFGPQHDKIVAGGMNGAKGSQHGGGLTAITEEVTAQLAAVQSSAAPGGSRTFAGQSIAAGALIDQYIFQAIQDAGVTPAQATTDYEFIRRATLDLTGRIPAPDRVTAFVNDTSANKRAALVDELLGKPEWVDKWTMFLGDLYKNNSTNSQIRRYQDGVKAFNAYIRASLQANKPYDQIARDLISAQGGNSYLQGQVNFIVGGVVTGGPVQDIWDQQTTNAAETFLGISHVNCLLCHNGRGHLDALSLWGSKQTRQSAWGLSSFMSHTQTAGISVNGDGKLPDYWAVSDNTRYKTDYPLNTTTGNRPARQPVGTATTVPPVYMFDGRTPAAGQDYRVALGTFVTSDFQFARAAVNYFWEQFFEVGLVSPSNQFDLARLDPDNPPPAPWALQASNPRLLNALAQAFIDNKYDVKWLMRQIVNSRAYQLSSRYNETWNAAWEPLFARKFVRRLWGEEVHDAIAQSSNIIPTYNMGATYGTVNWAMQLPEPLGLPDGNNGNITGFLDAFFRGNRDDETRIGDGAILQALNLMNDNFVMNRISSTSTAATANSLLVKSIGQPNDQLVNTLFLAVLSRTPTDQEKAAAIASLGSGSTRNQAAENLLWSLYNKVDFTFNY